MNKRWASIKSMVKEKKVSVMTRNQSPSPNRPAKSPPRRPSKDRRLSLVDGPAGTCPQNMLKFEIPKTIAELKNDLQHQRSTSKPNRKLLRLNTELSLTSQNKSAPSSPVVSAPIRISEKRRLTIAPLAPVFSPSPETSPKSSLSPRSGILIKSPSPSPKHASEMAALRVRRASYAPAFIAINVTGVEDEDDESTINSLLEENINLSISPSLNSMCDPKYWDNATPDDILRLKPPQRDRLYNRRRSSALSNSSAEESLSRSTYSLCERDLIYQTKEKILNDRRLSLAPQLAISQLAVSQKPRRTRSSNRLEAKLIADLGELKLSVLYLGERQALKVTVIRGENIGGKYKNDSQVNPFVTVALLPGKVQKQSGKVAKCTKNPLFNEEFIFSDMDWETLEHHMLRICVQNQQRFKNDDLGEILLPLLRLDPDVDNRMWKDLRKKCQNPMQVSCGDLKEISRSIWQIGDLLSEKSKKTSFLGQKQHESRASVIPSLT